MYNQQQACGAQGCGPANDKHFRNQLHRHSFGGFRRPKYNVPLNIVNAKDHFEIHLFATGFSKENIKITVSDDLLFLSGNKELAPEHEPSFLRQEFPIKSFERTVVLNGQVDVDQITATQTDGVLIVMLPKTDETKSNVKDITVV